MPEPKIMHAVEYDPDRDSPPHLIEEEEPRSRGLKYLLLFLKFLLSHVGLTVLVMAYTVGGAWVFISIEKDKWLTVQNRAVEEQIPEEPEPDYLMNMTFAAKQWKASWMDDKVLRFWNYTHQINDKYPDDWQAAKYEHIQLWEIELNAMILNEVANIAKRYATNKTKREIQLLTNKQNAPKWDFPNAFLYALSIVTTIGYGHVYPYTDEGKLATILYAIIGIPIMLAFLANIGNLMAKGLRLIFDHLLLMKCCRNMYKRRREARLRSMQTGGNGQRSGTPSAGGNSPAPIRVQKQSLIVDDGTSVGVRSLKAYGYQPEELLVIREQKKEDKSVPVILCIVVMVAYLFGGAVLFWIWEWDNAKWSLWDSLYFCFITLSTIGLGDLVPGAALSQAQSGSHFQPIVCCFYILIGLALLASCFNLLHDSARKGFRVIGKKVGLVKKKNPQPRSRRSSSAAVV